jgi:hypothetical protein
MVESGEEELPHSTLGPHKFKRRNQYWCVKKKEKRLLLFTHTRGGTAKDQRIATATQWLMKQHFCQRQSHFYELSLHAVLGE